jgi:hypothetical protein
MEHHVAQVETGDALREPLAQLPHRADQEEWVVRRIVRGEPVAGRDHGPEALGLHRRLGELHEEHGREGCTARCFVLDVASATADAGAMCWR